MGRFLSKSLHGPLLMVCCERKSLNKGPI
uniref:Uncharacterized protein n=1 Tax=Arundo donax TaxID=35708 RepID=A0A0A9B730_ARUDO